MSALSSLQTSSVHTVLVVGASGFLASFIVAGLQQNTWRVLRGVRTVVGDEADVRHCDLNRLRREQDWLPLLDGVDAVVNVAGILRQTHEQRFETIHHDAPLALARACVAVGVRRFVQISALGDPGDGEFIASKHRFDDALLALPLTAVVLRPSVVYSTAGSYGGTSLLRALAATPGVLPVPGDGNWRLQPLAAEDLAELVVRALRTDVSGVFDVGGPQPISLLDYQRRWRTWLRLPPAPVLHVPAALISIGVALGDLFGRGPLGGTMWRMLRRGNVPAPDAHQHLRERLGFAPRALGHVLDTRPSQVQDRWHARLHPLAPTLRFAIVLLFGLSAWAGFATPAASITAMAADSSLAMLQPVLLARAAAAFDLVLGLALLVGIGSRATLTAMLLLVAIYTAVFGVLMPQLWLDPLGGLAKNLVVMPALAVMWVLADRR